MAACNQHPQEALLSWQGPSSCPTELSSRAEQADPGSAPSGCAGQPGSQNRFVKSSAQAKEAILPFKQSREPPLPSGTRKGRCATQRGTDNESVASEHSLGHFQTGSKSPSWTPRLKHSQVFSHRHPLTRQTCAQAQPRPPGHLLQGKRRSLSHLAQEQRTEESSSGNAPKRGLFKPGGRGQPGQSHPPAHQASSVFEGLRVPSHGVRTPPLWKGNGSPSPPPSPTLPLQTRPQHWL